MIDGELLAKIATDVALERLASDLRELIVYSGNKDLCEVYSRYMDEMRQRDEQDDNQAAVRPS